MHAIPLSSVQLSLEPSRCFYSRIYSEEQPGEASTALFIKHIGADDGGEYSCKATYAANQQISAEVRITVYGRLYFQLVDLFTNIHVRSFTSTLLNRTL